MSTHNKRKEYLDVPFKDKERAKSLGARWDKEKKRWYAPDYYGIDGFSEWNIDPNLASDHFYILSTPARCWKCKSPTIVYALGLPAGHEYSEYRDSNNRKIWNTATWQAITSFVRRIPRSVFILLNEKAPGYKPAYSAQAGYRYFMNRCDVCGTTIGDFPMHNEPGGEFHPANINEMKHIKVERIDSEFEANAAFSVSQDGGFKLPEI
ncbi:DUF5710 domain-containing protein [Pseudomonas aeruginosa]|uniref:DUF5710 domain-containing protein n=1 Tax=Pseudomonas aeruginosa TaxID=287 RepID=UPI000AA161B2|nr:DUF5710 domain-containing protein [Pseudomonas aeruginosa]